LSLFIKAPLEVTAIDTDEEALRFFKTSFELLRAEGLIENVSVRCECKSITAGAGEYDLVLAGSVLNELEPGTRMRCVTAWLRSLRPTGSLIVIEPALRETSRDLHAVRDAIIGEGIGHVFAPCTRTQSPCPALADPRDWCHEDRPITLSPRAGELGNRTALREHGLKFSYLVLCPEPRPLVQAGAQRAWRVVSQLRNLKGKRECFLCSDRGRVRMTLLKRHRSDANLDFNHVHRGDVVLTDQSVEDKLGSDSIVTRLRPI
jgi:ribosomal protein RSM22 (predicted rRNA methylase)